MCNLLHYAVLASHSIPAKLTCPFSETSLVGSLLSGLEIPSKLGESDTNIFCLLSEKYRRQNVGTGGWNNDPDARAFLNLDTFLTKVRVLLGVGCDH